MSVRQIFICQWSVSASPPQAKAAETSGQQGTLLTLPDCRAATKYKFLHNYGSAVALPNAI